MKVDVIELLRYSIQWIQIKNLVDTEIGNSRQTADDLEQKLGNVLTLDFSLSLSWINNDQIHSPLYRIVRHSKCIPRPVGLICCSLTTNTTAIELILTFCSFI